MKKYQIATYALLFMLSINIIELSPLAAKGHKVQEETSTSYFPEKRIRKLLAKSSISEDKWPEIIQSLRQKTETLIKETEITELTSSKDATEIKKNFEHAKVKIKRAVKKGLELSTDNVSAIEQKLRQNGNNLGDKLSEKYKDITESKEIRKASSDLKRAKQRINVLVMRLLEEELADQGI